MAEAGQGAKKERSFSLDVFRGLTIAGMILVNTHMGTDRYGVLEHAVWNGFTPTDLVFPSFVFIMGVSIIFSMSNRSKIGQSTAKQIFHIFYRAAIIFFLGFIWHIDPLSKILPQFETIRIMGVLQRLALCYLFTSLIVMFTGRRGQLVAFVACVGGYWLLMKYAPVPGHGAGVLARDGNLAGYIDNIFLKGHLHAYNPGWDPEGLLHTLPAIGSCLLGALAAHWLRGEKSMQEKMAGLFVAGNIFILAGFVLDRYFPINKNLWSPSYVCLAGGLAMNIYAVCIWFVDFKGWNKITLPFVFLGMNSLFAYLISDLMKGIMSIIPVASDSAGKVMLIDFIFKHVYEPCLTPKTASFLFSLSYVILWMGITGLMYRKKWFVKI
ncbi:MAG: heparan-alpha-glucosaminide N-acetyltransferase domain-containing protein [bacterium]